MQHSTIATEGAAFAPAILTIERKPLLAALRFLERKVIERCNTIPILSNVCFTPCGDRTVEIYGTDLDLSAIFTLPATWENPERFTLDVATLADLVNKGERDECRLEYGDKRVTFTNGRVRSTLSALPADDVPFLRPSETLQRFTLPAEQVAADFARVAVSVCKEEARYYLCGIMTGLRGGDLVHVATNGHSMSIVNRPAPDGSEGLADMIIPDKAIKSLLALLKGGTGDVGFECAPTYVTFTFGGVRLACKLIDGSFPEYERIIPTTSDALLGIAPAELQRLAASLPETKRGDQTGALTFEFSESACRAGHSTEGVPGSGSIFGDVACTYAGQDLTIGFNPRYLEDFAKLAGGALTAEMAPGNCPALWLDSSAPHWRGVLMPVRVGPLPAASQQSAVAYPDYQAPAGQAASLWDVTPCINDSNATKGKGAGERAVARVANEAECLAYATDYARRCGIPGGVTDYFNGIAIIGEELEPNKIEEREVVDFATLTTSKEAVTVPAVWSDGACCLLMPGRRQSPVTVEAMNDAGIFEGARIVETNAKGEIALDEAGLIALTGLEPVKATKARKPRVSKAKPKGNGEPYIPVPVVPPVESGVETAEISASPVGSMAENAIDESKGPTEANGDATDPAENPAVERVEAIEPPEAMDADFAPSAPMPAETAPISEAEPSLDRFAALEARIAALEASTGNPVDPAPVPAAPDVQPLHDEIAQVRAELAASAQETERLRAALAAERATSADLRSGLDRGERIFVKARAARRTARADLRTSIARQEAVQDAFLRSEQRRSNAERDADRLRAELAGLRMANGGTVAPALILERGR